MVITFAVISDTVSETIPDCGIENEIVVIGLNGLGNTSVISYFKGRIPSIIDNLFPSQSKFYLANTQLPLSIVATLS